MAESEPESTPEEEAPKKEPKPKKEGKSFDQELKERFGKWGYTTIFDYIVLIAGLYGLGWFFYYFIQSLISSFSIIGIGTILYWIISILVLLMITLFPFFSKLVKKMHEKWKILPMSFITSEDQIAKYVLFLNWWNSLLFWLIGTRFLTFAFWWWGLMWILISISLFKELFNREK
ncbi:MAG: hypothetical protein GF311_09545 [Candidatus Lokiarchaeota archaeon]|nr:hypothetical protein [Candidatus Lokiarchaeota archaeon]